MELDKKRNVNLVAVTVTVEFLGHDFSELNNFSGD
jgi:hypothetical protein